MATFSMTCLSSFTLIAFLLLAFQSTLLSLGDNEAQVRERQVDGVQLASAVFWCLQNVKDVIKGCSAVGEKAAYQLHKKRYGSEFTSIKEFPSHYWATCRWHKFQCIKAAVCKCEKPVRTWMIYAQMWYFLNKTIGHYRYDTVPEATFDARQFVCPIDTYEVFVYVPTNAYWIFTLILPVILGLVALLGILGVIIPNKCKTASGKGKASDTGPTSETMNQDMAYQEYPGQYQEYYQQYPEQYQQYQQYPQEYPEEYPGQYAEYYQQYPDQYAGQYQEYPGQYEQYPGQYQAYPEQYPEQYQQQAQQPGIQANPTDGVSQPAAGASNQQQQQQPPLASTESSPVGPRVL